MKGAGFRCHAALTVSELLSDNDQPQNLVEYLWGPLCIAALNTLPGRADAQTFLNVVRDSLAGPRSASDLLLPRVDYSALFPDAAADYLRQRGGRVQAGESVSSVRPADDGFEVMASASQHYSHVIVAVGPHRLENVVGHLAAIEPALAMVRRFEYEPIYSVYLQYDPAVTLPQPMIGIRDCMVQWVFDRGRLCGQHGMLAAVISASGPHQALPHEVLAEQVHRELAERFALPRPQWHQVIAEKRATFACLPGLHRPANITAVPRLFLAGDYTAGPYPATLEGAVRSGVACARHILAEQTVSGSQWT